MTKLSKRCERFNIFLKGILEVLMAASISFKNLFELLNLKMDYL